MTTSKRVLVCGGRDFALPGTEEEAFLMWTLYYYTQEGDTIIEGEASGADKAARKFAEEYGCNVEAYPADWKAYGKAAGHIRNWKMLEDGKPDLVIAFPGGKGTADMVKQAKAAGVEVIEVEYN